MKEHGEKDTPTQEAVFRKLNGQLVEALKSLCKAITLATSATATIERQNAKIKALEEKLETIEAELQDVRQKMAHSETVV